MGLRQQPIADRETAFQIDPGNNLDNVPPVSVSADESLFGQHPSTLTAQDISGFTTTVEVVALGRALNVVANTRYLTPREAWVMVRLLRCYREMIGVQAQIQARAERYHKRR